LLAAFVARAAAWGQVQPELEDVQLPRVQREAELAQERVGADVVVEDVGDEAREARRRRPPHDQSRQRAAEPAALPLVGDDHRDVGRRVVVATGVPRHADDVAARAVERGDGVAGDVVELREAVELSLAQVRLRPEEAVVARLLAEPVEQVGEALAVGRPQRPDFELVGGRPDGRSGGEEGRGGDA